MTIDTSSLSRRGLIRTAGKVTAAAALTAPFRGVGGVAWAASSPKTYRKWIYAKPMADNKLTLDQFKMVEEPMPDVPQGKCLIEVKVLNIHSGTRSRLGGQTKLGDTDKSNYACARVIKSRDKSFKEGDIIACQAGWQTHQVISSEDESIGYGPANEMTIALNGTKSHWNYVFRPQMVKMWSPEILMDVFGTSGTTAYFGMRECGPIMPTDQVAVAGTTGSVGALAAQLVKARGAYCVGFGGGPERAKWCVDTLGVDKGLDYRAKDLDAQLKAAFPKGIDVYSDGVGGSLSESIAKLMNPNSRYFSYGTAAAYYDENPAQVVGRKRWLVMKLRKASRLLSGRGFGAATASIRVWGLGLIPRETRAGPLFCSRTSLMPSMMAPSSFSAATSASAAFEAAAIAAPAEGCSAVTR